MVRLKYISYILLSCAFVFLSACSENDEFAPDEDNKGNVYVKLRVNSAFFANGGSSQVAPDGEITEPDPALSGTQHASVVKIYFFAGWGDQAFYTGRSMNVEWEKYFMEKYGKLPDKTAQMEFKYPIPGGSSTGYTMLGVALSRKSAESFETDFEEYTPLSDAKIKLGKTAVSADIRKSEIYVGTLKMNARGESVEGTDILKMYRRVAGIMGWFKNVPVSLPDPDTSIRTNVAAVRISLYDRQNTALYLVRRRQKPIFNDFVQSPASDTDGQVLVSIPRTGAEINGGSFVLPAESPMLAEYTLRVELVDASGKILKSHRAKLPQNDELDSGQTGGGTGIIDTESAFRFPIVANHFYAIGTSNKPLDLKNPNGDILITLDPTWDEELNLDVTEKMVTKP